jgi:aminoglycoside phosphotransferase (APT) family kinase protein
MNYLNDALDADFMTPRLRSLFGPSLEIKDLSLKRHKEGRRALVYYEVENHGVNRMLGKLRYKGLDRHSFQVQQRLFQNFEQNPDLSVPKPLGLVPELNMWLQSYCSGEISLSLESMPRVAQGLYALHQIRLEITRRYTLKDEMQALEQRLHEVAKLQPAWSMTLERIWQKCLSLAAHLDVPLEQTIHRDFYFDQILLGEQVTLLDFDLLALGDPALDVGNYLGHLTELGLREGHVEAYALQEEAFLEHYQDCCQQDIATRALAYQYLTLARHIWISTRIPERQKWTASLINYCLQNEG